MRSRKTLSQRLSKALLLLKSHTDTRQHSNLLEAISGDRSYQRGRFVDYLWNVEFSYNIPFEQKPAFNWLNKVKTGF